MGMSNERKASLRWEIVDAAFSHIETLYEQGELASLDDRDYMIETVRRFARHLNIQNHIYI